MKGRYRAQNIVLRIIVRQFQRQSPMSERGESTETPRLMEEPFGCLNQRRLLLSLVGHAFKLLHLLPDWSKEKKDLIVTHLRLLLSSPSSADQSLWELLSQFCYR